MTLRRAVSSSIDARALAETGQPVTITRTGQFHDPRYGQFEITPAMLSDMVKNFDAQTYGPVSYTHLDVYKRQSRGIALAEFVRECALERLRQIEASRGQGLIGRAA